MNLELPDVQLYVFNTNEINNISGGMRVKDIVNNKLINNNLIGGCERINDLVVPSGLINTPLSDALSGGCMKNIIQHSDINVITDNMYNKLIEKVSTNYRTNRTIKNAKGRYNTTKKIKN